MRQIYKLIVFPMLILFVSSTYGQIWPLTPMVRFGNTVYYEIEKNQSISMHGTNLVFDKEPTNRYFDVLCRKDSIEISINGKTYLFGQKDRKEPRQYKEHIFYSRRILRNNIAVIKYMKLIEIKDSSIVARANIRYRHHIFRKKEILEINRDGLKGIFLGTGKNYRTILYCTGYGGALMGLIIL